MKRRAALHRRVLILCEGVTEEVYAKALRTAYLPRELQRTVLVEVVRHKKNDPKNLIAEAKFKVREAKKEKAPYDDVWLFFDDDNSPHLESVFEQVEKQGFRLAFTSISLEYWFILHFEDCGKAFLNGVECEKHLKRHWPEYHKTKINHFMALLDNVDSAKERAENHVNRHLDTDVLDLKPYTSVHELIDFFKELGVRD